MIVIAPRVVPCTAHLRHLFFIPIYPPTAMLDLSTESQNTIYLSITTHPTTAVTFTFVALLRPC